MYLLQFIDIEEVKDFASNTSNLAGEQYDKLAELLTIRDKRVASMVALVGDAWQTLSEKHT